MKVLRLFLFGLVIGCLTSFTGLGQNFTETIKGTVSSNGTSLPINGAQVIIRLAGESDTKTALTNEEGYFEFIDVPVGRFELSVGAENYEPRSYEGLLLISGKETILDIGLEGAVRVLDVVQINETVKGEPMNRMATVSAYVLNIEETQKFAGSLDDPMRLVTSYPGIIQLNSGFNTFSVRGNAPVGMLYRLEGIPIHNPNHFAEIGSTGGFVTQFSTHKTN